MIVPIVLAALVACQGCGASQPMGAVSGVVTLDGQPLGNVLVVFIPAEAGTPPVPRATGIADAAGRFTLTVEDGRPGAVLGNYRVVLEDLALAEAPRADDGSILVLPPKRIPQRYTRALDSPIAAAVEAGKQTVDIRVTTYP